MLIVNGVPEELASMVVECLTNSCVIAEVMRVGGGVGQPRTPTTMRSVSYTAGDAGKIDPVCPSGPIPSLRSSNVGTAPWSSGLAFDLSRAA